MNRRIISLLCVFYSGVLVAQKDQTGFATYLFNNELYPDLISLLTDKNKTDKLNSIENFYLGWSYYTQKELDLSSTFLLRVDSTSTQYEQARFFSAFNHAFLGNYPLAKQILNRYTPSKAYQNLHNFEQAGLHLLQHNTSSYNNLRGLLNPKDHLISNEIGILDHISKEIHEWDNKSPWLAGLMSAIIPGTGKMYAGKIGSGISSLLTVGILGVLSVENYLKDGLSDPKTILFSTMFTLFHIGNIYGSIYAVKDVQNDFNKKVEHRILFHLHIPLRNAFK